jgi:RecA/RadA recombinase
MLLSKREKLIVNEKSAVSTGSTLLNLACTDRTFFGFIKGGYYFLVGDSTSGKTWLSLTCFAEACRNPQFKDYRLIFDDVEGGALMDMEHYFGSSVVKRMEPPAIRDGKPVYSSTVESFYFHISDLIEQGDPFIYLLDSQDALTSRAANKKFRKERKAKKQEELSGSYGDGKAKYHSEHLRMILSGIRRMGSILVIISQTRDNLGFGFEKKTRSGGRSLKFYSLLEIWTSVKERIKKTVRGKERTIGVVCQAEVKKNRFTGKVGRDRSVLVPIYYDLGIDDVGSCVDYLIEEGHWEEVKGRKKVFEATEFKVRGTRDKLIKHIEQNDLERDLSKVVGRVWREIDAEFCITERKKRYV